MTDLWRIALEGDYDTLSHLEPVLETLGGAIGFFEKDGRAHWRLEGLFDETARAGDVQAALAVSAKSAGIPMPETRVEAVADRDWLTENLASFPPVPVGRYFLYGSHYEGTVPAGRIGLQVEAGAAFGSGEHGTTQGCLRILDGMAKWARPARVLDVGCGSAVLAMAAARTWPRAFALGTEIDKRSVRMARETVANNNLTPRVKIVRADGYRHDAVRRGGPWDLILANILARPLMGLAGDLAANLAPGGSAVLSGLLKHQERRVLAAHEARGLVLREREVVGNWATLRVAKPAGR